MAVFIGDSEVFGSSWSTPEISRIFSDRSTIERWCKVLVALAQAQSEFDLIPARAAEEIAKHCRPENFPSSRLAGLYQETGHSTAGLITLFTENSPSSAAEYFYFGATVQDLTDTATALAFQEAGRLLIDALKRVEDNFVRLTTVHRATPMLGRTHGQFGSPVTFGFKCAIILEELRRHADALPQALQKMEFAQLAGAVGGLGAMGDHAFSIRRRYCELLSLREPEISWTSSRDRLYSLISTLGLLSATASRFANEIYNLQRSGIAEIREAQPSGAVNSISMPHKINPELSEQIGSLHLLIGGLSQSLRESACHEHERDGRAWKIEWACVPGILSASLKQLRLLAEVSGGLQVDRERMLSNIEATREHCFSEALQFTLAKKTGLIKARKMMADLYASSAASNGQLSKAAGQMFQSFLSSEELREVFDLNHSIRHCVQMCDLVLQKGR